MTDVSVNTGPAPVANEAPVNPNPVNQPNPVGSQAPDKPVGDFEGSTHRPPSRSEAIQKAFERASNPTPARREPPKAAPPAAQARPGHNQPPEATPREKTSDSDKQFDLRKRPAPAAAEPQPRDRGRFAPRAAPAPAAGDEPPAGARQPPAPQQPMAQQPQPGAQAPQNSAFRDPPQRMSEAAKRDWATTPESVRGDFHRMHQEFSQGFQRYKADAEAFQPVRRYHDMARQHGTTLDAALQNYTSMEARLFADPIAGLEQIVHNLGIPADPKNPNGARINLRDIAYHVLSMTPDQLRASQMQNNQNASAHQIGALHQEVAGLKNQLQQMHDQQRFTYSRAQVDHFAASHPRFDELGKAIEQELKFGYDLETAYRRANLLYPPTHAAQTRTDDTSAQTRQANRSISGAPDVSPSNGASRPNVPREISQSPRDAVTNAIRRVRG